MMNRLWVCFGAGLLMLLSNCTSMEIKSESVPTANFSGYSTYQWVQNTQGKTGDPRIDNPDLDQRIRRIMEANLSLKGYRKALNDDPDFLVTYFAALKNTLRSASIHGSYDYPYDQGFPGAWGPSGRTSAPHQYEKGVLIIHILDGKTRQLVWRGSAKADVDLAARQRKKQEQVREAVRKILEQFPPQ